jgi:tRNA (mo5U34)-methyltransferase
MTRTAAIDRAKDPYNLQAPPITPTNAVEERIAALAPWFHNIALPSGEQTAPHHPLGDFPRYKWDAIAPHLPRDLTGATALDIGCNAGFYALELARRGARVTAIDHDERYLQQARWVAAEWKLQDRIDYRTLDIYQLARPHQGLPATFDLVLFMGVLYHLRHPLLGLDIAAWRTGQTLIFQTLTTDGADQEPTAEHATCHAPGQHTTPRDLPLSERARLSDPAWPRMAFIEHAFASDRTNWWVPSDACCRAMLRSVGMHIEATPGHETYICRKLPARTELPAELRSLLG